MVVQSTCYHILKKHLKNLFMEDYIPLSIGFRQQFCTCHTLINTTEKKRNVLDDRNIVCGVFYGLTKSFWYWSQGTVSKIESIWDSLDFKWLAYILSVVVSMDP